MDREAGLQELLGASFQNQMSNVYTSIPCIVVAVRDSLNGQMVDIQPTINQRQKDNTTAERQPILGVPVSFQVSKNSGLTFPISVGDTGLAIFSMRNLDAWKAGSGLPAAPLNFAKFDKGDAIFLPGIQPPGVAVNNPAKRTWPHNTNDTVLVHNIGKSNETEIRLLIGGGVVINTTQDVEVNCQNLTANVEAEATVNATNVYLDATGVVDISASTMNVNVGQTNWNGNITQVGNYTSTGNFTFNGILFSTHDHIPGPGPSNP